MGRDRMGATTIGHRHHTSPLPLPSKEETTSKVVPSCQNNVCLRTRARTLTVLFVRHLDMPDNRVVRCRAIMAHVRQSRPDYGPGLQEKVILPLNWFLLRSTAVVGWCDVCGRAPTRELGRKSSPQTRRSSFSGRNRSRRGRGEGRVEGVEGEGHRVGVERHPPAEEAEAAVRADRARDHGSQHRERLADHLQKSCSVKCTSWTGLARQEPRGTPAPGKKFCFRRSTVGRGGEVTSWFPTRTTMSPALTMPVFSAEPPSMSAFTVTRTNPLGSSSSTKRMPTPARFGRLGRCRLRRATVGKFYAELWRWAGD